MKVTAIISDRKSRGAIERWRGPTGTVAEKQAACIWALNNFPAKLKFYTNTESDELLARGRLRRHGFPSIDCARRVGYWLMSFDI